jgi:hypothetical protein
MVTSFQPGAVELGAGDASAGADGPADELGSPAGFGAGEGSELGTVTGARLGPATAEQPASAMAIARMPVVPGIFPEPRCPGRVIIMLLRVGST